MGVSTGAFGFVIEFSWLPWAMVAFHDQKHKDRKPVRWGWLGARWHCWGLQRSWELPASPLLAEFNNKMPLFLKLLLVLFCYLWLKAFLVCYTFQEWRHSQDHGTYSLVFHGQANLYTSGILSIHTFIGGRYLLVESIRKELELP